MMKACLYMAWQYVRYYRWQTLVLVVCLSTSTCLPLGVRLLVRYYQADMEARSLATPLVFGVRGHRFDLAMNALYFRTDLEQYASMTDLTLLRESQLTRAYPLFVRHTASGIPIAGVSTDYFAYRGLAPAAGTLPLLLGDVVLGSEAATRINKGVGDFILSDQVDLYNLAARYPLRMRIVGVLSPTGSVDDEAIFADIKTTWIIKGLAHGHDDLASQGQEQNVLSREQGNIVGNAAVTTYVEITDANIASFHFHGKPGEQPLTSIICVPHDPKSGTILKARYELSENRQLLVPASVIDELLRMIFKIEFFLHSSLALVAVATVMLLGLIVLLSVRLRKREIDTLHAIGCSRRFVVGMVVTQWAAIAAGSLAVSAAVILLALRLAPNIGHLLK